MRYNAEDQYELKVIHMCLLSEVLEKYAKTISVILPISDITDETIGKLTGILTSSKGNSTYKFIIVDESENNTVELNGNKFKINISDFVKILSKLTDLTFRLN